MGTSQSTGTRGIEDAFSYAQDSAQHLYADYEWDQTLIDVMWVRTLVVCFLSLICVITNGLLICFILTYEPFQDLKFFPLVAQSLMDILGPGVANLIYEMYSYIYVRDEALRRMRDYRNWPFSVNWIDYWRLDFSDLDSTTRMKVKAKRALFCPPPTNF